MRRRKKVKEKNKILCQYDFHEALGSGYCKWARFMTPHDSIGWEGGFQKMSRLLRLGFFKGSMIP